MSRKTHKAGAQHFVSLSITLYSSKIQYNKNLKLQHNQHAACDIQSVKNKMDANNTSRSIILGYRHVFSAGSDDEGVSLVKQQRHLFECLDFIKVFWEAMHER